MIQDIGNKLIRKKLEGLSRMENYQRKIHGQGKDASFKPIPALKLSAVITSFMAAFVLTFTAPTHAQIESPEMFLAPLPGSIHIYSNDQGMEKRQRCTQRSDGQLFFEEQICCFGPGAVTISLPELAISPMDGKRSITDHYTLYADKTKLIRTAFFGDIVLFDFTKNVWTVPIISSPGLPKEATCTVASKKWMQYKGKNRLIVTVQCKAYSNDKIVHESSWTLASGLGYISMDDFELTSIETQ